MWESEGETCASSRRCCSAPRSAVQHPISPSHLLHHLSDLPQCPFRPGPYRNVWTKCWLNLKVSGIRIHLDIYAERLQLKVKCQLFQSLRPSINNTCLLVWSAVYGNEFHWAISTFLIFRALIRFELIPQSFGRDPLDLFPLLVFGQGRPSFALIKVIYCVTVFPLSCHIQPSVPSGVSRQLLHPHATSLWICQHHDGT